MESVTFGTIIDLVSSLGTVGVLLWIAFQFQRGEILSRAVYEDLTTRILNELCSKIVKEMHDMLKKEREKEE